MAESLDENYIVLLIPQEYELLKSPILTLSPGINDEWMKIAI